MGPGVAKKEDKTKSTVMTKEEEKAHHVIMLKIVDEEGSVDMV